MIEQRTPEWHELRAGKITASMIHAVMAYSDVGEGFYKSGPRKGQPRVAAPLKARTDYKHTLAAERITGKSRISVSARALEHGRFMEPEAVAAYEMATGVLVEEAGFMLHPDYPFIGASPDFLVSDDGGGEVKCPESSEVHLETLLNGLPAEHVFQIQAGLWVTGRAWWHFVSYHADFPEEQRLYVQRVAREDAYIAELEAECLRFESEVRAIVASVLNQHERIAA